MTGEELTPMKEALIEIEKALSTVEDTALEIEQASGIDVLQGGLLVDGIQDIKSRIGWVESVLSKKLLASLKKKDVFVALPNGAVLEKKWSQGQRKKWDTERLATVAVEKIIMDNVNPETGAIDAPISQIALQLLECVGIQYWKVTELKELDIDPDDFSEKGEGKNTIKIHKSTISGIDTLGDTDV